MDFRKLLNELSGSNTGKIDSNLDDRMKRIEVLTKRDFVGKVYGFKDLQKILSSMKEDEEKWKIILYGAGTKTKESPKTQAVEIERVLQKMDDSEIENAIPENNPDGEELNSNQQKVYDFIDGLEARFQKIAIGDLDSLFRAKAKKTTPEKGDEPEEYTDDESSLDSVKKKINNIIPIKINAFGDEYIGIIRPGSAGGSNGIITWQKMADSFSVKMDHYEDKYDSLKPEQKAEYDSLIKSFTSANKLPKRIPLIRRNTSGDLLKVHETEDIKALKSRKLLKYNDDPDTMSKVADIIVGIVKDSGKSFAGQDTKNLSREQIAKYLGATSDESGDDGRIFDVPAWAIGSSRFWNEVEKLI